MIESSSKEKWPLYANWQLCKIPERPPFVFKMADKTSKIASMCVTPYSSVPYCSLTREYDSWLNGLQKIAQKLDQVCIKRVVKEEIIQLAELCLTRRWIISGTWWYWVNIWRYWLAICQFQLVLLGIRWYRVSKGLVCLYILEKVRDLVGCYRCLTSHRQQNVVLLSLSKV